MMGSAAIFGLVGLYLLFSAVASLLGGGLGGGGWLGGIGVAGNFAWALVNFGIAGFIMYGAMQMMKLQNYNLVLAAAVVSALPCTYCCCLANLALGIWAIVILMKPEVKAAFTGGGKPIV
jgi:hypothetical protein